ncbi:MAG: branched-chain amino acid ABC transporter substrate-binding protein [Actinobacteria bacterium]|nr:branched-chain amino acid ABC transporter substrate-binding protein [Actinomycetota bacterium]
MVNLRKRGVWGVLALFVAVLALAAAGCGGDDEESSDGSGTTTEESSGGGGGNVEALPSSSCTAIEYEGEGEPDVLLASDFPLQGSSRTQTIQIVEAIRYLLEESNYKAGDHNVAYQSCDDATAQAGKWDSGKCSTNAQAYAGNEAVVGVIGTFNSGCAAIEIPVLNQAPGGGVAMISPANTYVCLTEGGPGCDATEPDKYYPAGTRNYARVVAHDAYQGAAVAEFAKEQGVTSVYVLNDKEAYGLGVATNFRNAAEAVGIKVAGFESWDPKASSYEALFRKIGGTEADAVFLGGLIDENGAQVIKDKVSVLGANDGEVKLFAPDGFTTQQTIDEAPEAAPGMFLSVAGVPIDEFEGKGAEFAEAFKPRLGGKAIDPYAIYGAQAAQIMLDAIAASDGSRADVIAKMFEAEVSDGYLGSFEINETGDPSGAEGAVVGFTIYKATDKLETIKTISPKPENVDAARG